MSFQNPIRYLLLLLFTLLQCVAPLAHAHVNGNNAGQNVHMAFNDVTGMYGHQHVSDIIGLSTEEHHDAVVSMPPEYRSSVLIVDLPVLPSQCEVLPHNKSVTRVIYHLHTVSFAMTPYRHPFSQAPPF